jgi:cyclopropane-fatty-acyl-phospholipid synthase
MKGKAKSNRESSARPSLMNGFARQRLLGSLRDLRGGEISVRDPLGCCQLGEGGELRAAIQVRDHDFYGRLLTGGSVAAAAAYFDGDWDCDDLTALFRILIRNSDRGGRVEGSLRRLVQLFRRFEHWRRANSKRGSRENIAAHYDLGNDFFGLWLDATLAYSCGIFSARGTTLRDASIEKFDRICRKLDLGPSDHLLEIGTGWGGFALHAASAYGCRITTTTISREQFESARERIRAAGLSGRITLLEDDYRNLSGRFTKLASIEMIEAVGHENFDSYFRKCSQLLEPEGSALIQGIVMPDQRYDDYLRSVDFIQRYVFPGGCLPSVSAIVESVRRVTDMRLVHLEDFGLHYAETLRRWRSAFEERADEVRSMGHSHVFIRLWRYYLCYCEAAFEERYTSVVQLQFDKPGCRRDALQISTQAAGRGGDESAWPVKEEWTSRLESLAGGRA